MTSLLVTGCAGFIGSQFARYWTQTHPDDEVVGLDLLTYAGNVHNLDDVDIDCVQGDICDLSLVRDVLEKHQITHLVHFAAESHNSLAVLDPTRFFKTNVIGTQTLLEAARLHEVVRFHHISTCEVYGDMSLDDDGAFREGDAYRPRTPYSASKAGADHAVRAYYETFGLPVTITNCCNNYGPYQFPEKVIPLFATYALSGKRLPIYQSSQNRREWIHVSDHCKAIDAVLNHGRVGETYNVGTACEASVDQIAGLVLTALGMRQDEDTVEYVADRPGHDRRYLLDSSKIRDELGWMPERSLVAGVMESVVWYSENEKWWRPLIGRSPVIEGTL